MISVIIPNYNNARYLGIAIQSVLRQTFTDYEIIVVDDGSTDGSKDVVNTFGDRVRYIWQENQGLAGARNTGIQAATGDMISLLDADDEWQPDYLEQMATLSHKYLDALVFYCMAQCMDVDGHELPQFVGGPPVDPKLLYEVLLRANFIIPSTVTFRKKPIAEVGYFDTKLRSCEDWDLWLRLLPDNKMVGVSQSLVRYRVHGSSLSANLDGMHTAAAKVMEKHFGPDDGKPDGWTPQKRRAYGGVYRYQIITFVQRQNNWENCEFLLFKALAVDPLLAIDLDFFYELGLGSQQVGFRGVSNVDDLEFNASQLEKLLNKLNTNFKLKPLYRKAFGTAGYALGLIAYGFGERYISRKYFSKALLYRPELLLDSRLIGNYFKSFLDRASIDRIKKWAKGKV